VDLAVALPTVSDANCFAANRFTTSAPTDIETVLPCDAPAPDRGGSPAADPAAAPGQLDLASFLDVDDNPLAPSYRRTPVPTQQPSMPRARTARAAPAGAPVVPAVDGLQVPA
jgi:hypothetical protein